jgi:hypothetical protein
MDIRQLFHGADGDKILGILARREILPNAAGEIFFSERRPDSVFMHGADMRRRASFAVRLQVSVPPGAEQVRKSTPGVLDTLVIKTARPLATAVLELYVRTLHGGEGNVQRVIGEAEIRRFLGS